MIRVMHYFQTSQRWPPSYIVENVSVVNSLQLRTLESMHNILGVLVLIDATLVGSRVHRPRLWWTNLTPTELLQSAVSRIKWLDVYMSDILDPHIAPQHVYHNDQVLLVVINCNESHGGHCPHWLALPVCMHLRTMDRGLCGTLQHTRWWSLTWLRGREPWAFP